MALLFMDGFDIGDYAIKGWTAVDTTPAQPGVVSVVAGRLSGNAINLSTASTGSSSQEVFIRKLFPAVGQATFGFAIRPTANNNNGGFVISLFGDAGSTAHLTLMSNTTTQALELRRGTRTGTLIASSAALIAVNTWAYVEIQATIADAGGTCIVRLNGSSSPIINFTGDTRNAGTLTTIDAITLGAVRPATSGGVHGATFDDFYFLDNSGASNTTFIGDVRISSLVPDGPGTDTQLAPTGSATNWQNVDEIPYSTADYNSSATVGLRDTYTLTNLPGSVTTIHALQSNIVAAKSDVTAATAKIPVRTGGNLYYGQTTALSTSYLTYSDVHQVNPNTTTAWTPGDVNGLEAGMEVA